MDAAAVNLVIFLLATFAAAPVGGLAGFAFGLVAAAVRRKQVPQPRTHP
jgi:hypothetical protein